MAGKNHSRGVSFDHDGETRTLRFGLNAMAAYQETAGEPFIAGIEALQENSGDFIRLRRLFWCGLGGDGTERAAGDIMDDLGLAESAELIGKAVEAAFPHAATEAEAPAGNGKKAKAAA